MSTGIVRRSLPAACVALVVAAGALAGCGGSSSPQQHQSGTSQPAKPHLPSDPGFGRQLTKWTDVPGNWNGAEQSARFCDPVSKKEILVVHQMTAAYGEAYTVANEGLAC